MYLYRQGRTKQRVGFRLEARGKRDKHRQVSGEEIIVFSFPHFPLSPLPLFLRAAHIRLASLMAMPFGTQLAHAFEHPHRIKRLVKFVPEFLVKAHHVW